MAEAEAETATVRAVTSFICEVKKGEQRIVGTGQVFRETDPIVKKYPDLFEPTP
jgi:hypothetical protein